MSYDVFQGAAFAAGDWGYGGFDGVGFYTGGTIGSGTATLNGVAASFGDPIQVQIGGLTQTLSAYGELPGGIVLTTPNFGTFYVFMSAAFNPALDYPITYGFGNFNPPCFVAGTQIATDRGEVAVESLRRGDRVVALRAGRFATVSWLGHRRVDCVAARGRDVWPVRIAANAFASGEPARDLKLSPDHAVYVDGGLIPIRYLINGATITQEPARNVTYWHVELAAHDILLAEGLACESYLDTGNRGMFANAPTTACCPPPRALRAWQDRACAPLRLDPRDHAPVSRRLLARTASLGHATTDDPALRVLADGEPLKVRRCGATWQAQIPAGTQEIRLHSRSAIPARMQPDSNDHRCLGIAVTRVLLGGHPVPPQPRAPGDPVRTDGWHPPESGWQWTGGGAALRCPALASEQTLEITAAPLLRYWLPSASLPRNSAAA